MRRCIAIAGLGRYLESQGLHIATNTRAYIDIEKKHSRETSVSSTMLGKIIFKHRPYKTVFVTVDVSKSCQDYLKKVLCGK